MNCQEMNIIMSIVVIIIIIIEFKSKFSLANHFLKYVEHPIYL